MKALLILLASLGASVMLAPATLGAVEGTPSAAGDNKMTGLAGPEQAKMTRSMSQMKLIVGNCLVWAVEHEGRFPGDLKDLLTDRYLGRDQEPLLHCPLLNGETKTGYYYYGKKLFDGIASEKVLVLSRWTSVDGRRLIGRKDGTVVFDVPKQEDFVNVGQDQMPPPLPVQPAPSVPAPAPPVPEPAPVPQTPAPATALQPRRTGLAPLSTSSSSGDAPAPTIKLSTSISTRMRLGERYRVGFPANQMPPGKENYQWIVEHPNRLVETAPLTKDIWSLHSDGPGVYRIHLEYRAGLDKHAVSNTVEITVP